MVAQRQLGNDVRLGHIQWLEAARRRQFEQGQVIMEVGGIVGRMHLQFGYRQLFRSLCAGAINVAKGDKQHLCLDTGHTVGGSQHPAGGNQSAATERRRKIGIAGPADFHFGHPRPHLCDILSPDDPGLSFQRRYRLNQTRPQQQGHYQTTHKITLS